jgi:hypothetical protein
MIRKPSSFGMDVHECPSAIRGHPAADTKDLQRCEQILVTSPHHLFEIGTGILPRLYKLPQVLPQFRLFARIEQFAEPFEVILALFS